MLKNAVDMHIHTAPDVVPRSVTDIGAARQASEAGMRAIMLKNHVTPTYARAAVASEAVPEVGVYGGIVLNAQVGGINPDAVETACAMGAKCVWMPTASSVRHISHFKTTAKPVAVFDDKGAPVPGLMDVFAIVAKADIILATGHLAPEESVAVLDLARKAGIKKLLVTHPEFEAVSMPISLQKELAKQGVFFERCFYATNSAQKLPVECVAEEIKQAGWESTIVSSDFGQDHNLPPVEGLALFLKELACCGIAENSLQRMVCDHPAAMLGL